MLGQQTLVASLVPTGRWFSASPRPVSFYTLRLLSGFTCGAAGILPRVSNGYSGWFVHSAKEEKGGGSQ
jgi:hypothetical protein